MTDSKAQLPAPPPSQKKTGSLLGLIALIITLVLSAALFVFFWQTTQTLQSEQHAVNVQLSGLLGEISRAKSTQQSQLQKLEQANSALSTELEALSTQSQFVASELTQLRSGSRLDWLLSETEYLLRLANQRLNLEDDFEGAELILSAADEVLKEASDPALTPVRIAVAEELLALQSISHGDQKGAYARLDALETGLDQIQLLPSDVPGRKSTPEAIAPEAPSIWERFWTALRSAVQISRVSGDVAPLLPPEQRYYLRQNLRLMLEQASLALLNKEDEMYQRSLEKAHAWMKQYFPLDDAHVQAYLDSIQALKGYRFSFEKPDISTSLRLLKARIETMYRQRQLNQLNPESTVSAASDTPIKADQPSGIAVPASSAAQPDNADKPERSNAP